MSIKPVNRTEQKKRYQLLGFLIYALVIFAFAHLGIVTASNEDSSVLEAIDHMLTSPLGIFPLNWEYIARGVLFGLLAPLLVHAEYLRKRDLRPNVENGSAQWNEDLPSFYKQYAEITIWPKIFDQKPLLRKIKAFLQKFNKTLFSIPIIGAFWHMVVDMVVKSTGHLDTTIGGPNMIFSETVSMSMNTRKTRRNNNVMVIGGSGTGKSRFVAKPNLLQANCSFVITDPSGELLETMGGFLERRGYEIRVFNLVQMDHSNCYNPFNYIRNEEGVLTMITALIKNTTPKGSSSNDPFWEKAETALLQALCFFLVSECNPWDRNFTNVMKLLRCAEVKEGQEDYDSTLDILFKDLKERDPEHIAVRQYAVFKQAAGKTAQSILVSCSVRLTVFNMQSITKLTSTDNIDLASMGDKQVALFCITPVVDTTFNFLVALMYTQLFETLYFHAETQCKGKRLPHHVRFILDEFANIGSIPEFSQKLATMRKYEISCTIIIQALSQIKAMYKDDWEVLLGNCDELLFLGGSDATTLEYISKKLGKETIRNINNSRSYGRQGSHSMSYNKTGRELMTPDELNVMDNNNCILFIRGLHPFFTTKYPLEKHPGYAESGDANDKFQYIVTEKIHTGVVESDLAPEKVRKAHKVLENVQQADTREGEMEYRMNKRSVRMTSAHGRPLHSPKPTEQFVAEMQQEETAAAFQREQDRLAMRRRQRMQELTKNPETADTPVTEPPVASPQPVLQNLEYVGGSHTTPAEDEEMRGILRYYEDGSENEDFEVEENPYPPSDNETEEDLAQEVGGFATDIEKDFSTFSEDTEISVSESVQTELDELVAEFPLTFEDPSDEELFGLGEEVFFGELDSEEIVGHRSE